MCPELRDPKLLKKLEEQDQRKLASKQTGKRREEDASSGEKSSPSTDSSPETEDPVMERVVGEVEDLGSKSETEDIKDPPCKDEDNGTGTRTEEDGKVRKRNVKTLIAEEG